MVAFSLSSSQSEENQSIPALTLLDVKNHLYAHFLGKTIFSVKDDLRNVRMGESYDNPTGTMGVYKETLVRAALDDMAKIGILLVLDAAKGVYILAQPLGTFNQNVVISPYTANLIADAFNFFARQTNVVPYVANKFAITDTEINAIAQICFAFRDEADELHDIMAGEENENGSQEGTSQNNPDSN